eukprot:XP_008671659.1 uncharacterized protein LOC103649093 [Zea mays]
MGGRGLHGTRTERAAAAATATAVRAARLAAAELTAARVEVEAAEAVDAARAAAAELEALRGSRAGSSASIDDNTDKELRLAREAAREQAAEWAAAHPHGACVAAAQIGADAPTPLRARAHATAAQTGVDTPALLPAAATESTEIAASTGGVALPPWIGTMVAAEAECDRKLCVLHTDNGDEFTAAEFASYCEDEGVQCHYSAPYNPQQNDVVERRNQTTREISTGVGSCTVAAASVGSSWCDTKQQASSHAPTHTGGAVGTAFGHVYGYNAK